MSRLFRWFGRNDRDLQEEIREHIKAEIRDNMERGMSEADARAAASRAFGNIGSAREQVRAAKPLYFLETLGQDVRFGFRLIRRNPLLSIAVITTLALGMGLNLGVFSFLNAELFRPRVEHEPENFFTVVPEYRRHSGGSRGTVSYEDYLAYRTAIAGMADLAGSFGSVLTLESPRQISLSGAFVTCPWFSVFRIGSPRLGRYFSQSECEDPGAPPVTIIDEETWREVFAARDDVLGQSIILGGNSFTVVGVAPSRVSGTSRSRRFYIPFLMQPRGSPGSGIKDAGLPRDPRSAPVRLDGRLKNNHSRAEVQAALRVIAKSQDANHPGRETVIRVTDGSLISENPRNVPIVFLILLSVTLVLLITCVNVSILMLSRATARHREIAVRLSLGAGRWRLLRMLLTETLTLSTLAGVFGFWLSGIVPELLLKLWGQKPPGYSMSPDWRVYLYLGGTAILAGILAGIAPAMESMRVDLVSAIRGLGFFRGSLRRWSSREVLITAQAALSMILIAGAGFVLRASYNIANSDQGFDTNSVLVIFLRDLSLRRDASTAPRSELERAESTFREIENGVRLLPGVEGAAYRRSASWSQSDFHLPGLAGEAKRAPFHFVSGEYFKTLGIPILRGRTFTAAETMGEPRVAIVSQTFARTFWPNIDPLGQHLQQAQGPLLEIVGIARDTQSGFFEAEPFKLYQPLRPSGPSLMLVRFSGDVRPVAEGVRGVFKIHDPQAQVAMETLRANFNRIGERYAPLGYSVLILAGAALGLVVIGVYGVVAFTFARRSGEIGIRLALGANRRDILTLMLRGGSRPIIAGVILGLPMAIATGAAMSRTLERTDLSLSPFDPLTLSTAAGVLIISAVLAMLEPSLRAAGSDPMQALRHE